MHEHAPVDRLLQLYNQRLQLSLQRITPRTDTNSDCCRRCSEWSWRRSRTCKPSSPAFTRAVLPMALGVENSAWVQC
jgi:hypothetical protein